MVYKNRTKNQKTMANSKVPHVIADDLHNFETLRLEEVPEPETHELREGVVEGVFHYSALTQLSDVSEEVEEEELKDRPEEEKPAEDRYKVGAALEECTECAENLLLTCSCARKNPVHSTATDDSSAVFGQEYRLVANLTGDIPNRIKTVDNTTRRKKLEIQ